jgi:hypothetical protein
VNEATFCKLAEYSIDGTLGISEACTFDLRCNFASHVTPLLFETLDLACSLAFSLVAIYVRRLSDLIIRVVVV